MEDYRRQVKIEALNKAFPGKSCGNPRCEELCAEAYDAAKSMRLDPADVIRRTIERELPCMSVAQDTAYSCRFGFMPLLETVALGREEEQTYFVFHAGIAECEKCKALDGLHVSAEDMKREPYMRSIGFWKQKNGRFLPHPHCKCTWEKENYEIVFPKKEELIFSVKDGNYGWVDTGISFNGKKDFIQKLQEQNLPPHSIDNLIIISHSGSDNSFPMGNKEDLENMTPAQIGNMKYYLHPESTVHIRMCKTVSKKKKESKNDQIGRETVQKLANQLGCRIRAYGGYVTAKGGHVFCVKRNADKDMSLLQRFFQSAEEEDFYPQKVEK